MEALEGWPQKLSRTLGRCFGKLLSLALEKESLAGMPLKKLFIDCRRFSGRKGLDED